MYKLFLCLRYLRGKVISAVAVLAVTLCVAMMVITISVMSGFLDKIESAAKGLFGDIVIDSDSQSGLPLYDEFIAHVRRTVPEIEAGTPFVFSYGMLRLPEFPNYRQKVTIAGIRLPQYTEVSDFHAGLFAQADVADPNFDPPVETLLEAIADSAENLRDLLDQADAAPAEELSGGSWSLSGKIDNALRFHNEAAALLTLARPHQEAIVQLARRREQLVRRYGRESDEVYRLDEQLDALTSRAGLTRPDRRMILGVSIPGLSERTEGGETLHKILPGHQAVLWIFPLGGRISQTDLSPNKARLTVVDIARTDVWNIDNEFVYLPFETLQQLNNMGEVRAYDDPNRIVSASRASGLFLRAADGYRDDAQLLRLAGEVRKQWDLFRARQPLAATADVTVQTWRQRQERVIWPIRQQRTLVAIMMGMVSSVAVVLVAVILYMIVVRKTRDIGVIKAVGASNLGVAGIFLWYGAVIGLVGALLGTVAGWAFVRRINEIQDVVASRLGYRVWSKEVFLFERIPNEVDWHAWRYILVGTIVAGVIGALLPAVRAARMQPVEALRYE